MAKVFRKLETRIWDELKSDIHRIDRVARLFRARKGKTDMSTNYNGPKFGLFRKFHKRHPVGRNISYEYLRNYENNSEIKLYRLYNQMRFTHLGLNREDLTPKRGK